MGKPPRPLTDPGFRAILSRRAWLSFLAAGVLLGALSAWYAVQDYYNTERELRLLLERNAEMLARSLARSSRLAIDAYEPLQSEMARHLLASARFIAHLDAEKSLDAPLLRTLSESLELHRIHLFDQEGRRVMTSSPECGDHEAFIRKRVGEIAPILEGIVPSLVLGLHESPEGRGKRFAAAVARAGGGAIMVTVTGQKLEQYLQSVGLGKTLAQLSEIPSVAFIAIQDGEGPVGATPGVVSPAGLESDPFLRRVMESGQPASRFTLFNGDEVLEEAIRTDLAEGYPALFRVGIRTDVYRSALQRSAGHGLLMGILFLAAGITLTGLLFLWQHHRFTRSRHLRELALSGRIMAAMDEAMVVVSLDGQVLRANEAATRLLAAEEGAEVPDVIRPLAEMDCGGSAIHRLQPDPPAGLPGPVIRLNDRVFLVHCQPLPAELMAEAARDGKERAKLFLLRDITELRAMEETVERQTRLAGLGRVVASVAHEIRNPLNAISLSVQTLQRRLATRAEPRDLNTLDVVREEIGRLNRLVEDLLVFSRTSPQHRRVLPVLPLLERVQDVMSEDLGQRGSILEIAPAVDCPDPVVLGSEERLLQVLVNLVRNSLEAGDGPIRIGIRLGREDGFLALTLSDSGPGFSPEALAHAMEPFFTTKSRGVGLGLALSAEIVRSHGGRMRLGNRAGGGAEVTLLLPEAPPAEPLKETK
ncbi:MAG: hypothetical protein KA419_16440 [Acidobacteria bacterium]|nr:hypothetical protein [Acidobacteriota bacterium]